MSAPASQPEHQPPARSVLGPVLGPGLGLGQSPGAEPAPGSLAGTVRLRVRYVECDPMGVAHHSSCVPWLEMGRTELLRATGQTYAAMEAAGLLLVVTRLEVRYRRPVRYDEVVEVRTRVESVSRVKIRHAYEVAVVERGGREVGPNAADDPAITAWTELACLTRDGRPTELPEFLRGPASRP